jgi:hypothetical protein
MHIHKRECALEFRERRTQAWEEGNNKPRMREGGLKRRLNGGQS